MTGSKVKFARRRWLTAYAPLLIWIGVILFLSSDAGAMTKTSRFIRPLLEFLFPSASEETLNLYHGYIRKLAHFVEYAVLGFLAIRAFCKEPSRAGWRDILLSAGFVLAVAVFDEFNQSFNAARTASYADIALDVFGGIAALTVFFIFGPRRRN